MALIEWHYLGALTHTFHHFTREGPSFLIWWEGVYLPIW